MVHIKRDITMVKYITMVQMELQRYIPKKVYGIKLTSISGPPNCGTYQKAFYHRGTRPKNILL